MNATRQGHLAMVLASAIISGTYVLGAIAAERIDPLAITVVRFGLAFLLLLGATIILERRGSGPGAPYWSGLWRYLISGCLIGFYFVVLLEALTLTDPTSIAIVFAITPLMSAGFGWLMMRQSSPPRVLIPMTIAGLGSIWVVFRGDLDALMAFDIGEGEALFFTGCVAHAVYTPLIRLLKRGEGSLRYTTGVMLGGFVATIVYGADVVRNADWLGAPLEVWLVILYISIVASAGALFLIDYATQRLTAAKTMAYVYLVPCYVVLWEGLSGHGWPALVVMPGIAATVIALMMLLRD